MSQKIKPNVEAHLWSKEHLDVDDTAFADSEDLYKSFDVEFLALESCFGILLAICFTTHAQLSLSMRFLTSFFQGKIIVSCPSLQEILIRLRHLKCTKFMFVKKKSFQNYLLPLIRQDMKANFKH